MNFVHVAEEFLPGDRITNDLLATNAHMAASGIQTSTLSLNELASVAETEQTLKQAAAAHATLVLYVSEPNPSMLRFATWPGKLVIRDHSSWWTPGRDLADPAGHEIWQLNNANLKKLYLRADRVLAVSNSAADRALHSGVKADLIRVVSPLFPSDQFVDLQLGGNSEAGQAGETSQRVLVVGRIETHSGMAATLNAFHILASAILPTSSLTIVGRSKPDWYGRTINETVSQHRLHCALRGHVSQSELITEYRKAGALLMVPEATGFGIRGIEAMLAGVPVVTRHSPTGSIGETIAPGALAFSEDDDDATVAEGMAEVLQDSALRSVLIAKGRSHAEQFMVERVAPQMIAELMQVG